MSHARDIALEIESEILRLCVLGRQVEAVVLPPRTRKAMAEQNIGTWAAGLEASAFFGLQLEIQAMLSRSAVRVRAR